MERLYQPDFSSIFGKNFCNALCYGKIDSLVYPIFQDVEKSTQLQKLITLKDNNDRNYFYTRKASLHEHFIELNSADITFCLLQAMNLGRSYGIENIDVKRVALANSKMYKAIYSFDLQKDPISELNELEKTTQIAGIVLYPSYIHLDLTDTTNQNQKDLFEYCKHRNYFIKIDMGNTNFPENNPEFICYKKLKLLFSIEPEISFVLSGVDFVGNFSPYFELLKLYKNTWIEIDPRTLGGITPHKLFDIVFNLPGFIQNLWNRMTIGSATPTLEISQICRGFNLACENMNFSHKNLIRLWAFRNLTRLNTGIYEPKINPELFFPIKEVNKIKEIENQNEIHFIYSIMISSFSINQLIYFTDTLKQILRKILEDFPRFINGELFIRSYHTTTSLIINEHEFGNYLDLHYHFAKLSEQNSSEYLHTVSALENRADFNHFDHLISTEYGSKQIILPIIDKNLHLGSREDLYVLITFGPRTISLFVDFKFYKEI